jgi:Phage tail tube protein
MAAVNKIDSNVTGLRYAEEATIGNLPASGVIWNELEPNEYGDFGGEYSLVARNPINAGRQRQKGVIVDLDANGSFTQDLTQDSVQDLLQGYFYANFRTKGEQKFMGAYAQTFTADAGTDVITTATNFYFPKGYGPFQLTNSGGALPAGLSAATNYWIIPTGLNAGKLATSYANAIAGTAVDITGAGTGTHTITSFAGATGTTDLFTVGFPVTNTIVGSLVFASGFVNGGNNGLHVVTAVTGQNIEVLGSTLVTETAPDGAKLSVVGIQSAAGDLDVNAAGVLPVITSTALDFTTLGLVPGEWIYIGDDTVGNNFTTAANNGWARVYTVTANALTLDQTSAQMVTEANTTRTVRIYFGRVIKNEATPSLQVRRTYQLERTLGASDDAALSQIQSEYIVGGVPSEATFTFETADKATVETMFMGISHEQRTGVTGVKAGLRPSKAAADAYNTSNDVARLRMVILDRAAGAYPAQLFAFLTDLEISINNNVTANKAVSYLGSFDMTAGQFEITGSATAYFSNVTAVAAVRNNSDVTFNGIIVKANKGMSFDIPLIALGNGRLEVSQDEPITLELEMPAAADRVFNHTLLMSFYDYLPTVAA